MVKIHVERTIGASPERVFSWLADPANLTAAPLRGYSYRIVRSFPAFDHEGGNLTLTPSGDDTVVSWVTTYTHPTRGGGKAMEAMTSRLLPWNFRAILARCATVLES